MSRDRGQGTAFAGASDMSLPPSPLPLCKTAQCCMPMGATAPLKITQHAHSSPGQLVSLSPPISSVAVGSNPLAAPFVVGLTRLGHQCPHSVPVPEGGVQSDRPVGLERCSLAWPTLLLQAGDTSELEQQPPRQKPSSACFWRQVGGGRCALASLTPQQF